MPATSTSPANSSTARPARRSRTRARAAEIPFAPLRKRIGGSVRAKDRPLATGYRGLLDRFPVFLDVITKPRSK
jgi:hypothetical protein